MRHLKKGKKFGRKTGQRKAFMKGLAANLVRHEKITTTETRAKELRSLAERLVTHGKKEGVFSLRLLRVYLPKKEALKMKEVIAPRYAKRNGGYTRIIKQAARRKGDAARTATIEFV